MYKISIHSHFTKKQSQVLGNLETELSLIIFSVCLGWGWGMVWFTNDRINTPTEVTSTPKIAASIRTIEDFTTIAMFISRHESEDLVIIQPYL
jgi:hypothetical protein